MNTPYFSLLTHLSRRTASAPGALTIQCGGCWRRAFLLRALAALVLCLAFTGCGAIDAVLRANFGLRGHKGLVIWSLSTDQVARGQVLEIVVEVPFGDFVTEELYRDSCYLTLSGLDAALPRGISFTRGTIERVGMGTPFRHHFQVTVAPDAPLEPFFVFAARQDQPPYPPLTPETFTYESRPIYVVASINGVVPQVRAVSPPEVARGATTEIDITGINFDPNPRVKLTSNWPGLTLGAVHVVSPEHLKVPVEVNEFARTGQASFFVETDEGRSTNLDLGIVDPIGAPSLTGVFPSVALIGDTTEVVVTGNNFEAGQALVPYLPAGLTVPGHLITKGLEPRDRRMTVFTAKTQRGGLHTFTLESVRGTAPGFVGLRGAELNHTIKPLRIMQARGQVMPGAVGQLLLTTNFQPETFVNALHPPTEAGGLVLGNLVALTQSSQNSSRHTVAVQFDASTTSVLGPHYLALESESFGFGVRSNLVAFNFVAPTRGAPLIRRTTRGQIRRGQTITETIEGENFGTVNEIRFNSRGITVTLVPGTNTATSIQAIFSAAPDADLTGGDLLTTFRLYCRGHRHPGNDAGYLVLE